MTNSDARGNALSGTVMTRGPYLSYLHQGPTGRHKGGAAR